MRKKIVILLEGVLLKRQNTIAIVVCLIFIRFGNDLTYNDTRGD